MTLPDSIAQRIVEESLPWDQAEGFSIEAFLRCFTLHDSHWIGIHLDSAWDGDATAIICFDPVWNNVGVAPTSMCADWPTLLIRFPKASTIEISDYEDIGGLQRGIANAESELITSTMAKTQIEDHYGGRISIVHNQEVKILCYSAIGEPISLKDKVEAT